jgi:hypothetical protein
MASLALVLKCYVGVLNSQDLQYPMKEHVIYSLWSFITPKGHFIQWPSVKWTKDSSNVIGGEQIFVHLAFTP